MSAEILDAANGILTLRITGKLTYPELSAVQDSGAEILRREGKMCILVLGQGFQGWEPDSRWDDISFQLENDQFIEKIAFVAEPKWEELVVAFAGKDLRSCLIEFFVPADLAKARAWLVAKS